MAISKALASCLNGKARSVVGNFKTEQEANACRATSVEQGLENVRVSSYLDHKKADGTKVYYWVVKSN
jgi:hypothetical protein